MQSKITHWVTEFGTQICHWMNLHTETTEAPLKKQHQARIDALTNAVLFLIKEVSPKPINEQILELEIYYSERFEILRSSATNDYERAFIDQEHKIACDLLGLTCDLVAMVIDVELLSNSLARRPWHLLEWTNDQGRYELCVARASRPPYRMRFVPNWDSSPSSLRREGLKRLLASIRCHYPDFYTYLLATFPKQQEHASTTDIR